MRNDKLLLPGNDLFQAFTRTCTQQPDFKTGEDVKPGDFVIKVNRVQDFTSNDEFMQPEKDMKLVAIEVEYNNPTGDKTQFKSF